MKIKYSDGFRRTEFDDYPTLDPEYFEKNNVHIHKLHGSVDWWSDESRQVIFRLNLELEGVKDVRNQMIYPAQKDDIFNYPFNIIQSIFIRTLHDLNELIVIGHKFADQNIVSAIKVALHERTDFKLTIINPEAEIIKEKIFQNNSRVNAISKKIEDWIPEAIETEYRTKLIVEKSTRELDERQKEESFKQKIIGEYVSSHPPTMRVNPILSTHRISRIHICPICTNMFSQEPQNDKVTCPKCGTVFTN